MADPYGALHLQTQRDLVSALHSEPCALLELDLSNAEIKEEAEDEVEVTFDGEELEIGFNVSYLMDALANVPSDTVSIFLTDASSSCLILPEGREDCQYVVMPMRL